MPISPEEIALAQSLRAREEARDLEKRVEALEKEVKELREIIASFKKHS